MGATSSQTNSSLSRSETLNSNDRKTRNFASTIKKRFSKKNRRFQKQSDYCRILRDFLSTWSIDNLIQLVQDYEVSSIIKEFYLQAELARPSVNNVSQDLRRLYDSQEVADVYLEFKGEKFPVHKSIVCSRCPLFRELLGKIYKFGTVVPIQIDIDEITTELFSHLLRYLYSGEICNYSNDEQNELNDYENVLKNLSKHVPNNLEFDLKHLLNTGIYSDVKLVFKNHSISRTSNKLNNFNYNSTYNLNTANSTKNLTYNSTVTLNSLPTKPNKLSVTSNDQVKCIACSNQSEYSCHAAVLASRSRFFRNLILKYQAQNLKSENQTVNSSKQSIKIVLDETYIQKRYISIVLNAIYCDATDILNLLPNSVCKCSNNVSCNLLPESDSQETNSFNNSLNIGNTFNNNPIASTNTFTNTISNLTGSTIFQTISNSISSTEQIANKPENYINEIIDLFVIGKFLELETLISICENLLVNAINFETVARLLDWSERSNGSEFVRRQCLAFLREEFATIATSQLLEQLNENQLIELIKSDYLQASEYEVMCSIFKWIKFRLDKNLGGQFCSSSRSVNKEQRFFREDSKNCLNNSMNSIHSNCSTKLNSSINNSFNNCTRLPNSSNQSFNQPNQNSNQQTPKKMNSNKKTKDEENDLEQLNELIYPYTKDRRLKKEHDLEQLRELIGPYIKHLRTAHVLPFENNVLKNALKNELITTLPPYMLNDDQTLSYERGIMSWINLENRPNFVKPRFFQMFYEEARSLLEERTVRSDEVNFLNEKIKKPFNMPDNLYMVNEGLSNDTTNKLNSLNGNSIFYLDLNADRTMIKSLKEKLINRIGIDLDYLDKETKNMIRQKSTETYLKILPSIRTLNLQEKYEILIYIQLKILREHNLPDEMLFFFEQDETDNYSMNKEKGVLNMNLKRRSLKQRKFSINSIDLENYLSYDSINSNLEDDQLINQELFEQDLVNLNLVDSQTEIDQQNEFSNRTNDQTEQINLEPNQINNLIKYSSYDDSTSVNQEKEISFDVFI